MSAWRHNAPRISRICDETRERRGDCRMRIMIHGLLLATTCTTCELRLLVTARAIPSFPEITDSISSRVFSWGHTTTAQEDCTFNRFVLIKVYKPESLLGRQRTFIRSLSSSLSHFVSYRLLRRPFHLSAILRARPLMSRS